MKTHTSLGSLLQYSTLSALVLTNPLSAIERPTPAAQPEETAANNKAIPMPLPEAQAQKVAYLGVFGEPISETLAAHLNLVEGIGLQLELVAGDSPAAKAGLQKHDIIISLAGKDINSQEDLRASITGKEPGQIVELKYISKGKAISKKLTLGSRLINRARIAQAPRADNKNQLPAELGDLGLPEDFLNKFPEKDREKLMKLFKGKLQGLDLQELQKGLGKLEGFNFNLLPEGLNPHMNKGLKFQGGFQSRIKMLDQDGSITLESTNDGKVIELLDKQGKLQYRGPYNTEADKASVPKDLRGRVEKLDIDNGLGKLANPNIDKLRKNNMGFKFQGPREFNDLNDIEKQFMEKLPKELREHMKMPDNFPDMNFAIPQANEDNNGNNADKFQFKFRSNNSYSTTQTDPLTGNRYTYKKENKKSQVEIYDQTGKLLYNGPYNTEADKASIPHEYRDFIQKLDKNSTMMKGNKLKLRLGQ